MKQWMLGGASFKNTSLLMYLSALVVYGTSLTLYAYQLRTMNFGVATITPVLTNIVSVSLLSFFYYRGGLSFYQSIGTALALVSILLFSK